jgi:hypothetical protein
MLRKLIFFFILISFSLVLFSQSGTLLLGAVGSDGIVITADSRGSIYPNADQTKQPIAYIDSLCKIFTIKGYPIAVAGNTAINGRFIYQIIEAFELSYQGENRIDLICESFHLYIENTYPLSLYPEHYSLAFLSGGYVDGKPFMVIYDRMGVHIQHGGTISNDKDVLPFYHRYADKLYSSVEIANMQESIVYAFANESGKKYRVGGPVSSIIIYTNNRTFIYKNDFSNRKWNTPDDFIKQVENGKIKLNLVPGHTRKEALYMLETPTNQKTRLKP